MTKAYSTYVAIDLAFTLEGREEDHLPERILGVVRINKLSMELAKKVENIKLGDNERRGRLSFLSLGLEENSSTEKEMPRSKSADQFD